jgi:hypothetical protein
MASGAGGNRSWQRIAYVGPWSSLNDDFGPYILARGFSKYGIQTTGTGAGYQLTVYGSNDDETIRAAVYGTLNTQFRTYQNMNPPPGEPTAAYGTACAIPESSWYVLPAPSEQSGTGNVTNPLIPTGTNASVLFVTMPLTAVRVKVTGVSGGSGITNVIAFGIP